MINRDVVVVREILGRTVQGFTKPFRCRGEDGQIYYVKGRDASRRSQISEWIAGCLAQSFGLPVADQKIVEVPEQLYEALPPDWRGIGPGLAFGSVGVPGVVEVSWSTRSKIPQHIRQRILVFDWWVRNADRTLTELGGNPNLLWDAGPERVVVIDHNQAFDDDFAPEDFLATHIFASEWELVAGDLFIRKQWQDLCLQTKLVLETAIDSMPDEWWYLDEGNKHSFTEDRIIDILEIVSSDQFWEFRK